MSAIEQVFAISRQVENGRNLEYVWRYTLDELDELRDELLGANGPDGVEGEAVDAIICLLDLVAVKNPDLTPAELTEMVNALLVKKSNKWLDKHSAPLNLSSDEGRDGEGETNADEA